ncbi:hypothetical protein TIFTF001_045003 [Ficus carica]|uniref:Uncharacterized protein n=1 Tax=Ficus carica TaxID=3494 RepID=A0AA87ZLM2_FICCA|nr:hypothetical protein TIFTF001_045003 [Ficus carica]
METRRFNNQSSRESSKQKKMTVVESRRKPEDVPDLTDFMNDMFFGTVKSSNDQKKAYNGSRRSTSSKLTEEWLDEPSRCDSPSRLVGSPRFAAAGELRCRPRSLIEEVRQNVLY